MLPVKKILAPTDFSEPSRQGVKLAVELAEHFRAELLLVHATPPLQAVSGASTVSGYYLPNVTEEIQAEAGAVADRLKAEEIPLQVPSRVHILNGRPANAITTLAGEEGADLIVIASRGASGWKHAVFGSVAERVLRQARCPVLVVTRPD